MLKEIFREQGDPSIVRSDNVLITALGCSKNLSSTMDFNTDPVPRTILSTMVSLQELLATSSWIEKLFVLTDAHQLIL